MMYEDYNAWIEGVRDWLDADHLSDTQINSFLVLAQTRLNRELNVFEMEASKALVPPTSSVTALPTDFNRVRQVSVEGVGTYTVKDKGEFVNRVAEENQERVYCIDNNTISLYPYLDGVTTVTFDYYIKVPLLKASVDSNVFSANYPDLLLFAALSEGSNFIVEGDRMQLFEAKYGSQLALANGTRNQVKYGSSPLKRNIGASA